MNTVNSGKKPVAGLLNEDTRSTTDSIEVSQLAPDDEVSITTTNNTYYLTVIDPETAQVQVRGGEIFRSDTVAEIAGSSSNSSFKPRAIYIGCSIEFFVNARRVRTSPVRAIRLLGRSEKAA